MNVLVTGGSTWFGQSIVKRLLSRDHRVVTYDEAPEPWRVDLPGDVTEYQGSITDLGTLLAVVRRESPDVFVNRDVRYGAETEQFPLRTVRVNVVGAMNVFEAAATAGVGRVVYESSIGVYGHQNGDGPVHESDATTDDDLRIYRLTQHAAEYFADYYAESTGVRTIGVRPSVCHSPLKDVGISSWSNDFVTRPALGDPMAFPYPADQRSSLLWVDDAAEVYARLADHPDPSYDVYNTGGHDVSCRELAEMVREFLPEAEFSFSDSDEQPLPHDVDGTRAAEDLGVTLRPLEETLVEHANWAREAEGIPPL